jgi:hypothetical protein
MPYFTTAERRAYHLAFKAGYAEGHVFGLREAITVVLQSRFDLTGARITAVLDQIADPDALRALLAAMLTVTTQDEVYAAIEGVARMGS